MRFDIITIFPAVFSGYFNESILGRAQKRGLVEINIFDLRDYTKDKHKTVDDAPYGGGPGMIMMAEPIYRATEDIKRKSGEKKRKIILLSAKGKKFNQKMAGNLKELDQVIFICGRYEGVDERVAKYIADEEVSIGNYVLTGGELPAMVIVDTVARLLPGVIKEESLKQESFNGLKIQQEHPQYTRPEEIRIGGRKRRVPDVLLSGNHKKIELWKNEHTN